MPIILLNKITCDSWCWIYAHTFKHWQCGEQGLEDDTKTDIIK